MDAPGTGVPDYPWFDPVPKCHVVPPGGMAGWCGRCGCGRRLVTPPAPECRFTRARLGAAVSRRGATLPMRRARVRAPTGGRVGSQVPPARRARSVRCRAPPRCCAATARIPAGATPCLPSVPRSPRATRRTARRGMRRRGRGADRSRTRHWRERSDSTGMRAGSRRIRICGCRPEGADPRESDRGARW